MRRMLVISAATAAAASMANAGITLDVRASSAPNVFGSPSWSAYASNALNSLHNNLGNIGNRATDPTAYEVMGSHFQPGDVMVSSFKSWRGQTNPTGAFANEYGNRLHFGLHAYGDGVMQFTLEDLTFQIQSSDGPDALGFSGGFVGLSFNGTTRFGVNWGADRIRGTGDDVMYISGNGQTLIDELVYVGVGNAFWPQPTGGQSDEDAIQDVEDYIFANQLAITGSYWIQGFAGSDTVRVIPLPTAGGLAFAGLLTLASRRRR